jgi:hypothetical protein
MPGPLGDVSAFLILGMYVVQLPIVSDHAFSRRSVLALLL